MKNIISLVVLVSSISFAQTVQSKSLIELKQHVGSQQSAVSSWQFSSYPSSISHRHPSPIIHLPSTIFHPPSSSIQFQYPVSSIHQPSTIFPRPSSSIWHPEEKSGTCNTYIQCCYPAWGSYTQIIRERKIFYNCRWRVMGACLPDLVSMEIDRRMTIKSFAQSRGGANLGGKEADYFANIGMLSKFG